MTTVAPTLLPADTTAWVVLGAAFLSAWILTWAVRQYALRSDLLDHPNERSSHVTPTPRGGGVAIVLAFAAGTAALYLLGRASGALAAAVLVAGLLVAALGFADDRRPLPARVRFAGHLVAAGWVTAWLLPFPALPVAGHDVPLGLAGPVLAVLFMAWSINLFNFMDGIDGIASTEAVTVALGGAALWAAVAPSGNVWVAVLLAVSAAGFLIWNFPPARIFMGDAGSGFLGLLLAVLTLWSGTEQPRLFWAWLILYGCFMVDASVTLVRRVRRGDKFYVAHRSHAYQFASRRYRGHRPVTLAVAALNLAWLWPLAAAVAFGHLDGLLALCLAYAPLVALAFRLRAGDQAAQERP